MKESKIRVSLYGNVISKRYELTSRSVSLCN